ncbi:MAG: Gfo/Idh/MocA family oxidoreductase, partial [Bacteroidota bacterium]
MKRRKAVQLLGTSMMATTLPKVSFASFKKKKLGIALVGLGNYATNMLAPSLQETQNCYLAGIVTGTLEKAKAWKEQYNIPDQNIYNYDTFDQIANNPDIDIVYIVLPNFMHAEYTIRAFKAGKHVICEKPMGMNAAECQQMIATQRKSGKLLQIGYRLFYEPHHLAVKAIGTNERWGKVKMMESSLGFRMGRPDSWRMKMAEGGGGAIMDLGVYCIQAARRMVGENPIKVTAKGYVDDKQLFTEIYETVLFQLEFPNGTLCNASTSFNAYVDRFHTAHEKGWLELKPAFNGRQKPILHGSKNIDVSTNGNTYQTTAQMDAFIQNI